MTREQALAVTRGSDPAAVHPHGQRERHQDDPGRPGQRVQGVVADRAADGQRRVPSRPGAVTGLTLTQACSQPGMVAVLASRTLLPNVSGIDHR